MRHFALAAVAFLFSFVGGSALALAACGGSVPFEGYPPTDVGEYISRFGGLDRAISQARNDEKSMANIVASGQSCSDCSSHLNSLRELVARLQSCKGGSVDASSVTGPDQNTSRTGPKIKRAAEAAAKSDKSLNPFGKKSKQPTSDDLDAINAEMDRLNCDANVDNPSCVELKKRLDALSPVTADRSSQPATASRPSSGGAAKSVDECGGPILSSQGAPCLTWKSEPQAQPNSNGYQYFVRARNGCDIAIEAHARIEGDSGSMVTIPADNGGQTDFWQIDTTFGSSPEFHYTKCEKRP